MKDFKSLFLLYIAVSLFMLACSKVGITGPQGPQGPQGPTGNANVQSITFTNITVPLDSIYIFNIPAITQGILDSGNVSVFYQNPAQSPDTWYPLPQYYFYNGGLVWLILSGLQLGTAVLDNYGLTPNAFTYRFDITAAN